MCNRSSSAITLKIIIEKKAAQKKGKFDIVIQAEAFDTFLLFVFIEDRKRKIFRIKYK